MIVISQQEVLIKESKPELLMKLLGNEKNLNETLDWKITSKNKLTVTSQSTYKKYNAVIKLFKYYFLMI